MKYPEKKVVPFFTFRGQAEEAVNYYLSIFSDSKIINIEYYNKKIHGDMGEESKVINCLFQLLGQQFMAIDIEDKHGVDFSWATSMFITCDNIDQFNHLLKELSANGLIMMNEPVFDLKACAWVTDKFNVTWQLIVK